MSENSIQHESVWSTHFDASDDASDPIGAAEATDQVDDLIAVHLEAARRWSRDLVARLLDDGYQAYDIGAAARLRNIPRVDCVRSFMGTTAALVAAAREGFDATDPDVMRSADIGVLPRFEMQLSPWSPRARFYAGDSNIRMAALLAWSAIASLNNPAQFFRLGGAAVWVKASADHQAEVEELTVPRMLFLLGEGMDWYKHVKTNVVVCRPPKPVAEHMFAEPHPPLPLLSRIVRMPVFDSHGTIINRPGYHLASGLFYAPRGLQVPSVLKFPTAREIAHAKSLLLDELFGDFPFESEADRTNLIALVLLPFIRDLIDGPTPLHVITKPTPGSGGSLLVEAAFIAALGKEMPMSGLPTGEAEVQRRITAALMTSPAAIVFDNVAKDSTLDSGNLSLAITATEWQDREIRTSKLRTLPVTNAWVATGNQVKVSDEIARRTVVIRLDPRCDNPHERSGFRHANLLQWAKDHRPELIWAALTLVQAWVAEGMPTGGLTLGKFESWARVTSGICDVADLPDLHANWREWHEGQPSDVPLLQKVWAAWRSEFADQKVKAAALLPIIGPLVDLDGSSHSAVTELGKHLGRWKSRVIDGHELVGTQSSGSMSWRLVPRT